MIACPRCGAAVPAGGGRCPACDAPLPAVEASAVPDPPFPPLPDDGLAGMMPDWLRQPPPEPAPPEAAPSAASLAEAMPILTEEDLPAWLRRLAAQDRGRSVPPSPERAGDVVASTAVLPGDDEGIAAPLPLRPGHGRPEPEGETPAVGAAGHVAVGEAQPAVGPPDRADAAPEPAVRRESATGEIGVPPVHPPSPGRPPARPGGGRHRWVAILLGGLLLAALLLIAWLAGARPPGLG